MPAAGIPGSHQSSLLNTALMSFTRWSAASAMMRQLTSSPPAASSRTISASLAISGLEGSLINQGNYLIGLGDLQVGGNSFGKRGGSFPRPSYSHSTAVSAALPIKYPLPSSPKMGPQPPANLSAVPINAEGYGAGACDENNTRFVSCGGCQGDQGIMFHVESNRVYGIWARRAALEALSILGRSAPASPATTATLPSDRPMRQTNSPQPAQRQRQRRT